MQIANRVRPFVVVTSVAVALLALVMLGLAATIRITPY